MDKLKGSTKWLLEAIFYNGKVYAELVGDWGITSNEHFEALRDAVRVHEIDIYQLNDALGQGEKITALLNRAGCNPGHLVFRTDWDEFCERYQQKCHQRDEQQERDR